MSTYLIAATWGPMTLSEEMDITSDLSPDNEAEYARNFIVTKWTRIFGHDFIAAADGVSVRAVT